MTTQQQPHYSHEFVTLSKAMRLVDDRVSRYARSDAPVLITGPTGVGKERVARAIHERSSRRGKPYEIIDCTTLPTELIESELFGHEKGAFTDARTSKRGILQEAHGGTVFLDEIGELPLLLQPKLLRFFQKRTFRPVGSCEIRCVDVRFVVATNKDLEQEVEAGRFRSDLFYRIGTLPLRLPGLDERKEEIPVLAQEFARKHGKSISSEVLQVLSRRSWPGNIRQLKHAIELAAVLSDSDSIDIGDVNTLSLSNESSGESSDVLEKDLFEKLASRMLTLEQVKDGYIRALFERTGFSQRRIADILDISLSTLIRRLRDPKK